MRAIWVTLFGIAVASAARAETLLLPVELESVLAPLRAACPACVDPGFLPCGTPDVQYGRRFASTAMQGDPPRAYLLARAPISSELTPLLRAPDREKAMKSLAGAFAATRLVVLEDAWRGVRVIEPSGAAQVTFDPAQHACFLDPARDLGCCLGDGPQDRGCLPKADPPTVQLRFEDATAGEALLLRWPVGAGSLKLTRSGAAARAATLYWCHRWERAPLRGVAR